MWTLLRVAIGGHRIQDVHLMFVRSDLGTEDGLRGCKQQWLLGRAHGPHPTLPSPKIDLLAPAMHQIPRTAFVVEDVDAQRVRQRKL
jgi:hypothetical protein